MFVFSLFSRSLFVTLKSAGSTKKVLYNYRIESEKFVADHHEADHFGWSGNISYPGGAMQKHAGYCKVSNTPFANAGFLLPS